MTRHEADSWFLRYRRHGDVRALARVFDLVAPELLLVAAHFARRGGEPEDLVQATFLAAIEAAPRWDGTRPLLPWLLGILANCARAERRRRTRSSTTELPFEPESASDDPLRLLADAETARELERALLALPHPYRHTMTLRWVHGLTPRQIAHSLGVPPATVKSHLQRGLAHLRAALPAGIAGTLAIAVSPAPVLAAVRERVLAAALAAAGAPAARGPLLRSVGAGIAIVALVVTVLLPVLGDRRSAIRGNGDVRGTLSAATAPASGSERESAAGPDDRGHSRFEATAGPERPLLVRVRHAGEVAPAAGVHVGLRPGFQSMPRLREQWEVTDAAGLVRFANPGAVEATVYAERGGQIAVGAGAGVEGVIDLEIPAGIDTQVRVLDRDGRPVPDAELLISREGSVDDVVPLARTRDDGGVFVRGLAAGRALSARMPGHGLANLFVVVDSPHPEQPVELVLGPPARRLAGTVLAHDGAAVGHAEVLLGVNFPKFTAPRRHGSLGFPPPHWLRTDANGRFVTECFVDVDAPTPVFVGAVDRPVYGEALPASAVPSELVLHLPRPALLRGSVRDREGRPLPRARVECVDPRYVGARRTPVGPPWTHLMGWTEADGSFAFPGQREGRMAIFVQAADGRRANTSVQLVVGGVTEWHAIVDVPRAVRGIVRDAAGRALAGWNVTLASPRGDYRRGPATTDPGGRFVIEDCDAGAYHLRAHDPSSAWSGTLATTLAPTTADFVELIVERRADSLVTGRLVDAEGLGVEAQVVLRAGERGESRVATTRDGGFRIGPVPAGPYEFLASVRGEPRLSLAKLVVDTACTKDLGTLRLSNQGSLELTVAMADAAPVRAGIVTVFDSEGARFSSRAFAGRGPHAFPLPAGEYLAVVKGADFAITSTRFGVLPGERVARTVTLPVGERHTFVLSHPYDGEDLEVRGDLFDASGRIVGRFVEPWRRGDGEPTELELRLPPGSYRIAATSQLGRTASCTFTVPSTVSRDLSALRF